MSAWPVNRVLKCVMTGKKVSHVFTTARLRKLKAAEKVLLKMPITIRAQHLLLDRSNRLWLMDEVGALHQLPETDIRAIAVRAQVKRPSRQPVSVQQALT